METEPSQPGLIPREPSFSCYCSNILAELVSMEEASEQHHVDYDFEFDWLPESKNNVLPLFNCGANLLEKHDHVETVKKDNVLPPLDVKKPEGLLQPVNYKKSNSVGSSLRRWSFKGLLRRSNSERGAPTRTNSNNNNSNNTEEEKQGEELGWDRFVHHLCPCLQPTHAEEVNEEKVVVMENKFSSKSSSTGSDRSDSRVFPIHDPEIVPQDKNQHENIAFMKEDDDSTPSEVEKSEEVKYKKRKSTGSLLTRWNSLKGLLRRSSSERRALRSTEEGTEDSFVFSRCFSLSSRSSPSKVSSTKVEEGEKLNSEGCMLYLCPCLASPPSNSMPRPKEADQDKAVQKEKKPSSKFSSTGSGSIKNNKSADLGKVDGDTKRPKIQNSAQKVYLKRNSKSWEASSPYRVDTIGFFAMVKPLMFFTASASASA